MFFLQVIVPGLDRQVEVVLWCRSQLLSAGLDGFIVLYDLAKLSPKKLIPSIGGAIWSMTKNKSETKVAIGTEDGYIALYEMNSDGLEFEKSFNKQDCKNFKFVKNISRKFFFFSSSNFINCLA